MKRALVTGASGFVGSHLVPYLHEKGLEIWAGFHRRKGKFSLPVHWIRSDLRHLQEALALIRQSRPHYVFHLAAQSNTNESWNDPQKTLELNVGGTVFLLEGILRFAPRARVVILSSAQVYGTTFFLKHRVRENNLANPLTPYAGSKLLMEMAALHFASRYGLRVVLARPLNQVGVRQSRDTVFYDFCRQIALIEKGRIPPVLKVGNLNIIRDFVHVRDAVRAYYLLATRGRKGEVYNVGLGRGILLKRALDFLARQALVSFKVHHVSTRFRKHDLPYAVVDSAKLKRLGWRPRESLWQGLSELLRECRQELDYNLEFGTF